MSIAARQGGEMISDLRGGRAMIGGLRGAAK
jgi:hypothetical protein